MKVAREHSIGGERTLRGVDTLVQPLSVVVEVPPPIDLHVALVCSTVALILVQTFPVSRESNIDTGARQENASWAIESCRGRFRLGPARLERIRLR
jgi:hypothetical protein